MHQVVNGQLVSSQQLFSAVAFRELITNNRLIASIFSLQSIALQRSPFSASVPAPSITAASSAVGEGRRLARASNSALQPRSNVVASACLHVLLSDEYLREFLFGPLRTTVTM